MLQWSLPCLGEKRGDLPRSTFWSDSGRGATGCMGRTWTSASFLRHCSLFLIIDCTEFSFSVTMAIWDCKETECKPEWAVSVRTVCVSSSQVPAAEGSVWLQTQGSECLGCYLGQMAPSPGDSSGNAEPPELPLWFGTCPPSDSPADKRPHHTNKAPAHERHNTNKQDSIDGSLDLFHIKSK